MKSKFNCRIVHVLAFLFAFISFARLEAQEKTKKQLKEEKKLEKQKEIGILVESKEFVFVANRVMPQSGRVINLTTVYNVDFHPEWIKSDLPFFGRAFSGVGYGGSDEGMKFEGKPTVFSIEKNKKAYIIKADVRGEKDSYFMILTVYFEGSAILSINSNNRSSISYDGEIEKFKEIKKTEN
ncbi:MAG TPA: DUF4251 domain-containing protein [Flavobacterium sp.]|nr:DUF4251 domain-containing protein [Flavobacterium sp.]